MNVVYRFERCAGKPSPEHQAISYFRLNCPARARSINLLEPEHGRSTNHGDLDPADVWAAVVKSLQATKNTWWPGLGWRVFAAYHLSATGRHISVIAKEFRISKRHAWRLVDGVLETFRKELITRELVSPDDEDGGNGPD